MKLLEALLHVEGDGRRAWSLMAGDVLLQCDISGPEPEYAIGLFATPLTEETVRSAKPEIDCRKVGELGGALQYLVENGRKEILFGDEWAIIEDLPVRPFY